MIRRYLRRITPTTQTTVTEMHGPDAVKLHDELCAAVVRHDIRSVIDLLDQNAPVVLSRSADYHRKIPLQMAVERGFHKIASILVQHQQGRWINEQLMSRFHGFSALDMAHLATNVMSHADRYDTVEMLIGHAYITRTLQINALNKRILIHLRMYQHTRNEYDRTYAEKLMKRRDLSILYTSFKRSRDHS